MKTRDLIVGFMVLVAIIAIILVYKNSKKVTPVITNSSANYQQIESKFPTLKVPANADRASLNNVSGGTGIGEAFRTYESGKFTITVIADLANPSTDEKYKGYLTDGSTDIFLGDLANEKGGYVANFTSDKDLSSFKKVKIVLNSTKILEGSF